jgi:nucleoside-diphosphate-sugar epimerase
MLFNGNVAQGGCASSFVAARWDRLEGMAEWSAHESVLITGASGFIGSALSTALASDFDIVRFSRTDRSGPGRAVVGSFALQEDLDKVARLPIDVVVHLAAADSRASDDEVLRVNVLGTHRLLQHTLAGGCRKFVLAGSIAATGCLSPTFVPLSLPIDDEHPCLATDAYGLSKAMVEDLARYFARTTPDAGFINLRIGVVWPDRARRVGRTATPSSTPFCDLAGVMLADVVDALGACVRAPTKPGVRVMNLTGPDATSDKSVHVVLDAAGVTTDLEYFRRPESSHQPVYSIDRIKTELGFVPRHSTRKINREERYE